MVFGRRIRWSAARRRPKFEAFSGTVLGWGLSLKRVAQTTPAGSSEPFQGQPPAGTVPKAGRADDARPKFGAFSGTAPAGTSPRRHPAEVRSLFRDSPLRGQSHRLRSGGSPFTGPWAVERAAGAAPATTQAPAR